MTLLVIEVAGAPGADLFSEGAPESLRYLMGEGFYGEHDGASLWRLLSPHLSPAQFAEVAPTAPDPELAVPASDTGDAQYLHLRLLVDGEADLALLDAALSELLDELGDEDSLAILNDRAFLVVSRAARLSGSVGRVTSEVLALTLLALSGAARPPELSGQALITEPGALLDDDDEAALRQRFRGLGYVA